MGKGSSGEDVGVIRSNEYKAMSNEYKAKSRVRVGIFR